MFSLVVLTVVISLVNAQYIGYLTYSDSQCANQLQALYVTNASCASSSCLFAGGTGIQTACFATLPSQKANTLRAGIWGNSNCSASMGNNLVTDDVLGTAGCLLSSYYTCSGGTYTLFNCSDALCSVGCTQVSTGPTESCVTTSSMSFSFTCTAPSSTSSTSSSSTSTHTATATSTSSTSTNSTTTSSASSTFSLHSVVVYVLGIVVMAIAFAN